MEASTGLQAIFDSVHSLWILMFFMGILISISVNLLRLFFQKLADLIVDGAFLLFEKVIR